MSARVAIVAALPRELAHVLSAAQADRSLKAQGVWRVTTDAAVLVAAGMGAQRVTLAVEAALAAGDVALLVSAGLAGSCDARAQPGAVLSASQVVDAQTGERYRSADGSGVLLATSPGIATVAEKARLAQTYGASMVDMEAATVARLARAHGLRFRAIKGISDGPEFELAGLSAFTGPRGDFRTAAFALHTMLRPWTWGKAIELGRGSNTALRALHDALRQVIAEGPTAGEQ